MTEQEFLDILLNAPTPKPIFFRLYYDSLGRPISYSMEDLPGNYIEIDAETFHRGPLNVVVRNGRIVYLDGTFKEKLAPNDLAQGTQCHSDDVSVIVSTGGTYWQKKIYVPD